MSEAKQIRAMKGFRDVLPPESALWDWVEQIAREVLATYNFHEIRLPVLEPTELFARSVGMDTDIVSKEMYMFPDPTVISNRAFLNGMRHLRDLNDAYEKNRGGIIAKSKEYVAAAFHGMQEGIDQAAATLVALRPEATASVVRAYIEHGMHTWPQPVKLYYLGPMFRRERPQKGRFRQFCQIGAEVLGQSDAPAIDAEVIEMLLVFLERIGLSGAALYINSIGCKDCRPAYVARLRSELERVKEKLGADSQRRIETNPLRVLDSKLPEEQSIIEKLPKMADHLCPACREHFSGLEAQLKQRGIAYEINWRLVRGLDYYMRTAFEITAPGLGAQNAVCGGGRYDGLVELLGGPPTKGIGFAIGTDRLILALQEAGKGDTSQHLDVFIAWMGAADSPVYAAAVKLARRLRAQELTVEMPAEDAKLKKSLGLADKLGARYAVIIGEDEVRAGAFTLKRLSDAEQKKLTETELIDLLKSERGR